MVRSCIHLDTCFAWLLALAIKKKAISVMRARNARENPQQMTVLPSIIPLGSISETRLVFESNSAKETFFYFQLLYDHVLRGIISALRVLIGRSSIAVLVKSQDGHWMDEKKLKAFATRLQFLFSSK